MNIGIYVQPTSRGQVVIPVSLRKLLGINENTLLQFSVYGQNLVIKPVIAVPTVNDDDASAVALLKSIQGSWGSETAEDKKIDKTIRKIELAAARKSRNAW